MTMLNNIFYMYSKMDNSSQILLFLIILVGLMLVSITVINCIIKKKNEKYDMKFNPIDRYTSTISKKEKTKEKPILKVKEEVEEIETLDEPEIVEIVSDDNSVEKIAELLEDGNSMIDPIHLTKFEEEQEQNAIISYDELVKRAGAKKIIYKTEKATINEEVKEEKIEIKNEDTTSKFKASQIISPIYGVQKQEKKDELEEFIDLENIPIPNKNNTNDDEMKKDVEFLNSLKTFRSEL